MNLCRYRKRKKNDMCYKIEETSTQKQKKKKVSKQEEKNKQKIKIRLNFFMNEQKRKCNGREKQRGGGMKLATEGEKAKKKSK